MNDSRERESQPCNAFDDERGFAIHDTCWYVTVVRAERGCPPPAPLRGLFRSLFMARGARCPRACLWLAGPAAHERVWFMGPAAHERFCSWSECRAERG